MTAYGTRGTNGSLKPEAQKGETPQSLEDCREYLMDAFLPNNLAEFNR